MAVLADQEGLVKYALRWEFFWCGGCSTAWRLETVLSPGQRVQWLQLTDPEEAQAVFRRGQWANECAKCEPRESC